VCVCVFYSSGFLNVDMSEEFHSFVEALETGSVNLQERNDSTAATPFCHEYYLLCVCVCVIFYFYILESASQDARIRFPESSSHTVIPLVVSYVSSHSCPGAD